MSKCHESGRESAVGRKADRKRNSIWRLGSNPKPLIRVLLRSFVIGFMFFHISPSSPLNINTNLAFSQAHRKSPTNILSDQNASYCSSGRLVLSMEPHALLTSLKNDGRILHAARGFFLWFFLTKSEPANTARVDLTSATTSTSRRAHLYIHIQKSPFSNEAIFCHTRRVGDGGRGAEELEQWWSNAIRWRTAPTYAQLNTPSRKMSKGWILKHGK